MNIHYISRVALLAAAIGVLDKEQAAGNVPFSYSYSLPGPSGQQSDLFGEAIDISGEHMVVGNYLANQSQVYNALTGELIRTIHAPSGAHRFGKDVAISDRWIVVGAFGNISGSAYVYERETGRLRHSLSRGIASGGSDWFGHSVAIDGDLVAVGAPLQSTGSDLNTGGVYLFDANSGSRLATLLPTYREKNPNMGWSVDIDGTTVITGAIGDTRNGTRTGATYIFEQSQNGTWGVADKIEAFGSARLFGWSVAIDGSTAVVGQARDSRFPLQSTGVAHVIKSTENGWKHSQTLRNSFEGDDGDRDNFGANVALDSDVVAVTRFGHEMGGERIGSVTLFQENDRGRFSQFIEAQTLFMPETTPTLQNRDDIFFGASVALHNETLAIGAFANVNPQRPPSIPGAAFVFRIPEPATWLIITLGVLPLAARREVRR